MERNEELETLIKPDTIRESVSSMDMDTIMRLLEYVDGRISYVDADQSMRYWYAEAVLSQAVELSAPQTAMKR